MIRKDDLRIALVTADITAGRQRGEIRKLVAISTFQLGMVGVERLTRGIVIERRRWRLVVAMVAVGAALPLVTRHAGPVGLAP